MKININTSSKEELLQGIKTCLTNANYSLARLLVDKFERIHGYPPGPLGEKDSYIRAIYTKNWSNEAKKTTFDTEIKALKQNETTKDLVFSFLDRCITPNNSNAYTEVRLSDGDTAVRKKTTLLSIGSCFAREIAYACGRAGIYCQHFDLEEEISSPVTLDNYLDFLYSKTSKNTYFSTLDSKAAISAKLCLESVSDIFLTLGVAIGPHDKNGQPVNLPKEELRKKLQQGEITLDPYDFNLLVDSLERAIATLKRLPKSPRIFLTLSPVPLYAFYGTKMNVMVADSVSKALLRAAYATFLKRNDVVTYLPTFELFRNIPAHVNVEKTLLKPFGEHDSAPRHPSRRIVEAVMQYVLERFILSKSSAT